MADTIAETIVDLAGAPQSVTTDGLTVQERSLLELIAADQYRAAQAAAAKRGGGIRFTKLNMPGAL